MPGESWRGSAALAAGRGPVENKLLEVKLHCNVIVSLICEVGLAPQRRTWPYRRGPIVDSKLQAVAYVIINQRNSSTRARNHHRRWTRWHT